MTKDEIWAKLDEVDQIRIWALSIGLRALYYSLDEPRLELCYMLEHYEKFA